MLLRIMLLAVVLMGSTVFAVGQTLRFPVHGLGSISIEAEGAIESMSVWVSKPINKTFEVKGNRFELLQVEPADYTIMIASGNKIGIVRCEVFPGTRMERIATMLERYSSMAFVRGRLVEPTSLEPIAGMSIRTSCGRWWVTDSDGNFFFQNHPAGNVDFNVIVNGEVKAVSKKNLPAANVSVVQLMFGVDVNLPAVEDGLVAFYPMENGTLTNVLNHKDSGAVFGAKPAADRFGNEIGAIGFDGTSRAEIPDAEWQRTLPMSVSFWMKVDSKTPKTTFILSKYIHPSGEGWSVFIENGRLCAGYFRDGFTTWSRVNINGEIRDGKWRHFVITVNQDRLVLYVDKARIPSSEFQKALKPTTTTAPVYLGRVASTYGSLAPYHPGFIGAIDDLAFYDRVLTEEEILLLSK